MKPESIPEDLPRPYKTSEFSEREVELLRLVATGASNKEIAQQLHISVNTVKVHLRNIFEKTGAASRTELAMLAVKRGLVVGWSYGKGETLQTGEEIEEEAAPSQRIPTLKSGNDLVWRRPVMIRLIVLISVIAAVSFAIWFGVRQLVPSRSIPKVLGETPRWQERAALPEARADTAVTVYDNHIYVIGGEATAGVTGAVDLYNPSTDTWESRSSKPLPVTEIRAEVLSGRIYIPGGKGVNGQPVNIVEVYDPIVDLWTVETPLPQPLSGYAMVAFEGDLYLFGGWNGREYVSTVYAYDPEQRRWNEKTPLPGGRAFLQAAVVNGKIFVFGGFDGRRVLDENWEYSPEKDSNGQVPWEKRASLPEPRYDMGAASLADLIVVVGGRSGGWARNTMPTVIVYSAYIDQWREYLEPEFAGWDSQGMVLMGMQFYLVGGRFKEQLTSRNLLFQPVYTVLLPIVP